LYIPNKIVTDCIIEPMVKNTEPDKPKIV